MSWGGGCWRSGFCGARGERRRQVINMIKQFIKGRVYVFIDAENVFYSQRTLGWRISYEKLMKYFKKECGYKWKNNLDIELAFEMVDTKDKYDTAILISGDSDFDPPITRIKRAGKRIIVMSTRGHVAEELLDLAKYIDLRKLKNEISQ